MQISFLLLIPEGRDWMAVNALCGYTQKCVVCVCLCYQEKELFPSHHISQHRPLEPIQHQLKRVGYNWRRRPAINLPSIP